MNRLAERLSIVSTNLDGFSSVNCWWFAKFTKLSLAKHSHYGASWITGLLVTIPLDRLIPGYNICCWRHALWLTMWSLHSHRYWTAEKDRAKRGLKPRLWFALFQCIKRVFVLHGFLFSLEVSNLIRVAYCILEMYATWAEL